VSAPSTSRRGGIDLPTLLTTAIASAVAAYVTSRIWAAGTLAAAAFTPVLVALLKEALIRPAEVVTRAVPVRGVVRSASHAGEPDGGADTSEAIEARIAQLGEAPGASRPGRRRAWQIAIVTGLLGFLLAAVIITVPELVAGSSASGGGRHTTFFGGKKHGATRATDTTTTTTPDEQQTETVPPASTVTVAPPAETITVPPPAPTPVPEQDEPPPAPEEQTPTTPATPPAPPAPPG
jgi:hypothetical protein